MANLIFFYFIVKFSLPLKHLAKFLCIPITNKPKLKQLNTHTGIASHTHCEYCTQIEKDCVYGDDGERQHQWLYGVMTQCVKITSKC